MDGMVALFAILALMAAAAPFLLAIGSGRALPAFLALLLTLGAVLVMTVAKGFGDTTLAVGAWTGAMICGFAAYVDRSLSAHGKAIISRLPKPDGK